MKYRKHKRHTYLCFMYSTIKITNMRQYIFTFVVCLFIFQSNAQTAVDTTVYEEKDTVHVHVKPEFPGGTTEFYKFMGPIRIVYDPKDSALYRSGYIVIEFIVEKNGQLSNIKAVEGKSLTPTCDQIIINKLLKSPRWEPGLQNGIPIRVRKVYATRFKLYTN